MSEKCPRCESPDPKLHPAMQHEGEVQICEHRFHSPQPPRCNMHKQYHGTVQMINTAPQIKHKWLLLYVPSDYGWEVGYWEGHRGGWRNRYGHAINPTHWTERPPEPTTPKV